MCRYLDADGHCAFHSDNEVKEYCVAGPCPDMQTYNELIDALKACAQGGACPEHCPRYYSSCGCGAACVQNLIGDSADAIERLQAENEELSNIIEKNKAVIAI